MKYAVYVRQVQGPWVHASAIGFRDVQAVARSEAAALEAVAAKLREAVAAGECPHYEMFAARWPIRYVDLAEAPQT